MKKYLLFIYMFLFILSVNAQPIYTHKDVEICTSKFKLAADNQLNLLPINQVVIAIGKSFLGTDYAASTLEKGEKESLVINLTGLDCYTFLESSLALARCIKEGKTSFEDYQKELINIRYRDGKLNGYPSRLHYFSDWVYDMNKRGIGNDITKELGGIPYIKNIDFMSAHIEAYKQLHVSPDFVEEISVIERKISVRNNFWIPQAEIEKNESKIQSGDIIGITTNIAGLDISHTGIAIRMDDGRIHLMHAPNIGFKVQITEKPLSIYIQGNKKQTGIIVLRPEEVK
jgi:hypothetical protein